MKLESETRPPMPFVVGMPFSGTTLLRLMLDSHPELAIPPGTRFVPRIALLQEQGVVDKDTFAKTILSVPTWSDLHIPNTVFLEELDKLVSFAPADGVRLIYRLYAYRFRKSRWGDKTPRYMYAINQISRLLPEAYFIHIIRDGRDVAASNRLHHSWRRFQSFAAHAREWKRRIHASWSAALHCPRFVEVKYEDLVTNPEQVLNNLCAAIQLPFSPRMLDYHLTAEQRMQELQDCVQPQGLLTRGQRLCGYDLLSHPPQTSEIGRWKQELAYGRLPSYVENVRLDPILNDGSEMWREIQYRAAHHGGVHMTESPI